MDVYCPKCGDPIEVDEIHERAAETGADFRTVNRAFQLRGCPALGQTCSTPSTDVDATFGLTRQDAAAALADLLGDDVDGAAAMMEDLGW